MYNNNYKWDKKRGVPRLGFAPLPIFSVNTQEV